MNLSCDNEEALENKTSKLTNLLYNQLDEYDQYLKESENKCNICCLDIRNPTKLSCGHTFCHDCLLESYKGVKCNFYIKNHRICPYCRSPSNYLPLQEGEKPIKGIHSEYGKITCYKSCKAIIMSGPKAGQVCNCRVKGGGELCGRHNKQSKKKN